MKLGIYSNLNRDIECKECLRFTQLLTKQGVVFLVCNNATEYFQSQYIADIDSVADWCDVFVAFGGDGTMLEVINACTVYDKPLLGVNMGKIGFLSEISQSDIRLAISKLLSGDYSVESRMMLQVFVGDKTYYALNEALFSSKDNCHVVTVDIAVDGNYTDKMRGDGVLVSTPTGSTAYSLACNGPILSPDVDAILINMVCPHTLHSCPLVVNGNSAITLTSRVGNNDMRLLIDGRIVEEFDDSTTITVKKSSRQAKFIRMNNVNFYQKLIKKLSYWGEINE